MKKSAYIFSLLIAFMTCEKKLDESNPAATEAVESLASKRDETNQENLNGSMAVTLSENTISVTGYLDVPPGNRAAVSPYYGGFVKDIDILPGQRVKKGDILLTLQNPAYLQIQQEYLESKEQVDYLKTDYDRQKTLADEQIASTKNFKKAETDYRVMLARYQSLKEQIKLMGLSIATLETGRLVNTLNLRAPFDGSIISVNVSKSVFADPKNVAVELINTDHIHLELDVYEKHALQVKKGQSIQFKIPETGDKVYQGEVHLVGEFINPKKKTIMVHGHVLDREQINLIPGMFVEATIVID
ncbi:efflux RND transporter periplasmic adaptor subunit [Ekhidna sp.]